MWWRIADENVWWRIADENVWWRIADENVWWRINAGIFSYEVLIPLCWYTFDNTRRTCKISWCFVVHLLRVQPKPFRRDPMLSR